MSESLSMDSNEFSNDVVMHDCGRTALTEAIVSGLTAVTRALLEAGADVNFSDKDERTPLHFAALKCNADLSEALLEKGAIVNAKDKNGDTPLILAAWEGHADVARALLEAGANVNICDERNWTPLHIAALRSHVDLVKALLEAGAIVNAKIEGLTPLMLAGCKDFEYVVRAIVEFEADGIISDEGSWTPLHIAASRGHLDILKALLEAGAIVNAQNYWGGTPLMVAVHEDHADVVRALLEAGADANISAATVFTPLFLAAEGGNVDIVKALLEAGAIANVPNDWGETPLRVAVNLDYVDAAIALLEAGADANIFNEGGTLLFLAANGCHLNLIKALLEAGATVNLTDEYILSELITAASYNSEIFDLIVLLIVKLNTVFQYIGEAELLSKINLFGSTFLHSNISQKRQVYAQEIERMKEENEAFYIFLRENDIVKVVSIWDVLRSRLNDQEHLKTHFPSYSQMVINKVNCVKREIFLHNHKPLVDFLSAHYRVNIQETTFSDIKRFFNFHRLDFMHELGGSAALTLIDFVDFSDIMIKSVPKLKVMGFGKAVKSSALFLPTVATK